MDQVNIANMNAFHCNKQNYNMKEVPIFLNRHFIVDSISHRPQQLKPLLSLYLDSTQLL